jgi:DNA-binding NtrC family response regulator
MLVEHILRSAGFDHSVRGVAPDVDAILRTYHWPGNVRELRNTLLRAIPFCAGDLIDMQALPEALLEGASSTPEPSADRAHDDARGFPLPAADLSLKEAKDHLIEAFEKRYLEDLLERCDGNLSKAARDAGVDRKTIGRMLKRHGIKH